MIWPFLRGNFFLDIADLGLYRMSIFCTLKLPSEMCWDIVFNNLTIKYSCLPNFLSVSNRCNDFQGEFSFDFFPSFFFFMSTRIKNYTLGTSVRCLSKRINQFFVFRPCRQNWKLFRCVCIVSFWIACFEASKWKFNNFVDGGWVNWDSFD